MRVVARLLSVVLVAIVPAAVEAQELSIADRVAWEEARLAYEEGERAEALVRIEELLDVTGPVPRILVDDAGMAFEARDYLKAEGFVMTALESADEAFKETPQYDAAFRLAARIRRTLGPLRDNLAAATPLPFADSLARAGFAVAMRSRDSSCEWKFDRGGLIGKAKDNAACTNGQASSGSRVRVQVTIEQRGGGSRSAAGIVFGREDAANYFLLRVHPRWEEVGDMSLVGVADGVETVLASSSVVDPANRSLRRWNEKGPWRIGLEIRGRRIDWFLNGDHVGTAYGEREIRGEIMAAAGGPDDGEFLFTDIEIDKISLVDSAVR